MKSVPGSAALAVLLAKKGAGSSVTRWAFMKNMQGPGDIQNEIEAAVRKAVR